MMDAPKPNAGENPESQFKRDTQETIAVLTGKEGREDKVYAKLLKLVRQLEGELPAEPTTSTETEAPSVKKRRAINMIVNYLGLESTGSATRILEDLRDSDLVKEIPAEVKATLLSLAREERVQKKISQGKTKTS